MSLYDKIAHLYDPWSASVVEDIEFYVEEARRSGGPVVELAVGTGRIAVPMAAAGIEVIGVDSSAGMLAVAREAAASAGVELDLRLGDLREPPVEGTYLGWLDCRATGIADPHTFFLEKAKVAVGDGKQFSQAGDGFVRLNFGTPRSLLTEGLERMRRALAAR